VKILLESQVDGSDGGCGLSLDALVNPTFGMVTHLVVRDNMTPAEFVVSAEVLPNS
jgi:hypothetical protein